MSEPTPTEYHPPNLPNFLTGNGKRNEDRAIDLLHKWVDGEVTEIARIMNSEPPSVIMRFTAKVLAMHGTNGLLRLQKATERVQDAWKQRQPRIGKAPRTAGA